MSAASLVETALVLTRKRTPDGTALLELLIKRLQIEIVSVDYEQARIASRAFRT